MIPNDSLYFAVDLPFLATLAAAVVDADVAVTAARRQSLNFERMELEALNFLWVC